MSVFLTGAGCCILCYSPIINTRCSSATRTCAIKQETAGGGAAVQFCQTGPVGCTVRLEDDVIVCYCDTNK